MARASMREVARQSGFDDKTVALCVAKAGLVHGRGGYDLDEALQACRDHGDLLRASGQDARSGDATGSTAREALANAKIATVAVHHCPVLPAGRHGKLESFSHS